MNTERRYELEPWREPTLDAGDTSIYSEHGRILYPSDDHSPGKGTCYRAYWMRLVKAQYGGYYLTVKHGGGEERFNVGYPARIVKALAGMESDDRFFMLYTMMHMHHEAARAASEATAATYRKAFAEDRLRKRKIRGQAQVKIWIERELVKVAA